MTPAILHLYQALTYMEHRGSCYRCGPDKTCPIGRHLRAAMNAAYARYVEHPLEGEVKWIL